MAKLNRLKIIFGIVLVLVLASNVLSISRWSESRGVYDDICYLRQAHLFQRFGAGGLDTDLSKDDDHYLAQKLQAINFPGWNDPARVPCHTLMPASNKYVLQYPPGTGFVLALFPSGYQVIPLYMLTSAVVFGFALLALVYASTLYTVIMAGTFGAAAIYLMINPTKASYSVAPTMIVCALAGLLTARLVANGSPHRLALIAAIGLLIGLSVNLRLPNLFLSAGYFLLLSCCVPQCAKPRHAAARHRVGRHLPYRHDADPDRERDQRRKSVRDHLWRRRRGAARIEIRSALAVPWRSAVHPVADRSCVERRIMARAEPDRPGCAARRREPGR
jgi:hypothetical protein